MKKGQISGYLNPKTGSVDRQAKTFNISEKSLRFVEKSEILSPLKKNNKDVSPQVGAGDLLIWWAPACFQPAGYGRKLQTQKT